MELTPDMVDPVYTRIGSDATRSQPSAEPMPGQQSDLLKQAYALLARWYCELRHTARHVTRTDVESLLSQIKATKR